MSIKIFHEKPMNKKDFQYDGYDDYLYKGLQGFMMNKSHQILSKNTPKKLNHTILEIGGGAKPHCSVVPLKGIYEYWVSDSREIFKKNANLADYNIKNHIYEDDPDFWRFKDSNILFTRIIVSHTWEHMKDPEGNLLKWVSLLEDDGSLDIVIPCDPGWAWRLGQLAGRKKAMKLYNMSSREIDLMMTREHINSCQNLIKIIKYYTNRSGKYFPFYIPLADINLFTFFRLRKSDFAG